MVEIAQLCKKYNAWLVVDQAYEHFLHGDQRYCRPIVPWRCRVILVLFPSCPVDCTGVVVAPLPLLILLF